MLTNILQALRRNSRQPQAMKRVMRIHDAAKGDVVHDLDVEADLCAELFGSLLKDGFMAFQESPGPRRHITELPGDAIEVVIILPHVGG